MTDIVVIADNIRSTHNIGSLFRTCDGFGVTKLYLTGYSAYPRQVHDERLPHLAAKSTAQIHKTALGAEKTVPFSHHYDVMVVLADLQNQGYTLCALEQTEQSKSLPTFYPPKKCALILGEEVNGITSDVLSRIDQAIEIPMYGHKESFNVSVAAGIALYALREHKQYATMNKTNKTNNAANLSP